MKVIKKIKRRYGQRTQTALKMRNWEGRRPTIK